MKKRGALRAPSYALSSIETAEKAENRRKITLSNTNNEPFGQEKAHFQKEKPPK